MKFLTVFALLLALAVPTVQAESRDREKPIEIQADHFFGDELKQVATYTGSVRVDQGTMRLTGQKLVLQETAQGYKKGTLTGELATFRQKRDPKTKGIEEWVSGKAEQIVYEERTGIITLTGKALVERSENGVVKDRARGNKIVYDTIRSRTIIQGVKYEEKGMIGVITISREKALNALNSQVLELLPLSDLVKHFPKQGETRCIALHKYLTEHGIIDVALSKQKKVSANKIDPSWITSLTFVKGNTEYIVGHPLGIFDKYKLTNPLSDYLDQVTCQKIEIPALSPDGYVLDYYTWLKIIKEEKCNPFTRIPITSKRSLTILTYDNIHAYKSQIVNLDLSNLK